MNGKIDSPYLCPHILILHDPVTIGQPLMLFMLCLCMCKNTYSDNIITLIVSIKLETKKKKNRTSFERQVSNYKL